MMIRTHFQTICLSGLLGAATFANAQLSKPALRQDLGDLETALTSTLTSASYTWTLWNVGEIAEPCKFEAIQNKVDPKSVLTFNVTYSDCSVPYVLCFLNTFPTSFKDGVGAFGKVPPRMRQYVNTMSFVTGGGSAYARGGDIVMQGNFPKVGVYIHEITHSDEFGNAFKSNAGLSAQTRWTNAYNADSAVPDNYARTNQVENLAQHPMFILYNDNVRDIRQQEPNYNRIINQQTVLRDESLNGKNGGQLYATKGVTCTVRYPFPKKVSTATTTTTKRDISSVLDSARANYDAAVKEYRALGITAIDPSTLSKEAAQKKTECQFH